MEKKRKEKTLVKKPTRLAYSQNSCKLKKKRKKKRIMTPMLYSPNVDAGPIFLSEVKTNPVNQSINYLLLPWPP
jgi:hypothetical protein